MTPERDVRMLKFLEQSGSEEFPTRIVDKHIEPLLL